MILGLDMDATDHVTCTKDFFIIFHNIKPLKISLPNIIHVSPNY